MTDPTPEDEALVLMADYYADLAAERAARIAAVRADVLAGLIGRRGALDRLSYRGFKQMCATLDDADLNRLLGDDR